MDDDAPYVFDGNDGRAARAEFFEATAKRGSQWRPERWPDLTRLMMYRNRRENGAMYVLVYWHGKRIEARTEVGAGWKLHEIGCPDLRWILRDGVTDREITSGESIELLHQRGHNMAAAAAARAMSPRSGWSR